ncbi:ABC transporter ATP-binding protein [Clostridium sp.]|uniref:ABC transporter ATP-binding protein n=1 Tax=Clostridium sp. TaxID=1506 RepID=UPI003F368301
MNVLEVKQLTKQYKDIFAVNQINMNVKKGKIYGFLGPNGAGKSTTIRMILGLIRKDNGSIEFFGKQFEKDKMNILKKVGALIEQPSYYSHLNAYDNMKIITLLKNGDIKEIDNILKTVGLLDVRNKKVSKFSLGMKQRLAIGLALINNPEIIILDEPTNGLDPFGRIEIRDLLRQLADDYNKTIIISSHILNEMENLVDDVGIINKGKMIYEGSLKELKNSNEDCTNLEDIFIKLVKGKSYEY